MEGGCEPVIESGLKFLFWYFGYQPSRIVKLTMLNQFLLNEDVVQVWIPKGVRWIYVVCEFFTGL